MANTNRYLTSLERISSFGRQTEPASSQQDPRTGNSGYFTNSSRPWDSSPFQHSAGRQDHLGFDGDEDVPLDAFDKELLAAEQERPMERQWQASQGLARISLPSRALATPARSGPRELRDSAAFSLHHQLGSSESDDLHKTPLRDQGSSSSSAGPASSPTVHITKQRQKQQHSNHSTATPVEASVSLSYPRQPPTRLEVGHAPPIVQGIRLVPATDLPDRFRSLFPFPIFNAVQSRSFPVAFSSDDNMVLSAPTGSGKTVIMELAICRLMTSHSNEQFKVVYQAPTKSLCSERFQDWEAKFGALDLQCAELTGDTDYSHLRSVQNASIIITTPEKWDSVTRKWKDHAKLMQLVKLFLIDEVHVLKDSRGATLEAVVSRMKSVGSNVRFVALSATVPNSADIAIWLGKCATAQHLPAHREVFGEEYRPVQLQKFVYGYGVKQNDFVFDSVLTKKLPEIIAKHSNRKPIMVFCFTRNSAIKTSKSLAELWTATNASDRLWLAPRRHVQVMETELRQTTSAGVAFHHAGLDLADRRAVEEGFLNGNINIICSTSTLAVGVNLPCYLVIIKGTVSWSETGAQEYADLEMMQMLGRAGRPQFESSACAVILTRDEKIQRYQNMVSGKEFLESSLHLNLIDHLNAEIGLGTVSDIPSAKKWLAGTFLFVRLRRNPNHYKFREKDSAQCCDENELLEQICEKDLKLLQDLDLISNEGKLKCTEFGDAMARYCIKFETMKVVLSLPPKAKISEIISILAQADEFHDIRMKAGEKTLFKEMNKDVSIKFPIKVDVALPAHKISLLIQSELGGVEFPATDAYKKHKQQYQQDKGIVFQHVNRLIRCIIDCQLYLQDSVSARHALELGRSLAARVWDSSPLQLKQLEQIGNIAVRKLAGAGINSMEILENTEPHRIEAVLQKNPPFGMRLLSKLADFPKLRVSVKQIGKESKAEAHVEVKLSAVIGFLNDKVPLSFHRKPIYICFMAETSDGKIVDFRRMQAKRIQSEHEILIQANLSKPTAFIACHVMCDEVAGTSRSAEIKLDNIPTRLFPPLQALRQDGKRATKSNVSPIIGNFKAANQILEGTDDFGDGGLEDDDLLAAETLEGVEVMDIDNLFEEENNTTKTKRSRTKSTDSNRKSKNQLRERTSDEPVRLENGKWACNHTCRRDNKACKHKCCNEGLDRPRKPPKKKVNQDFEEESTNTDSPPPNRKMHKTPFEATHSVSEEKRLRQQKPGTQETRKLEQLQEITGTSKTLSSFSMEKLGRKEHEKDSATKWSFSENPYGLSGLYKTEYLDDLDFQDLPMPKDLFGDHRSVTPLEYPPDESNEIRPDAVNDDLGIDEKARMVGLEDLVTIANEKDHFTFEMGDLDILGDAHSSSETLDNFCSSKPQRLVASGFFDVEEDMGFFETPLTHIEPQSLRKRSTYNSDIPLSELSMGLKPVETRLITGECSNPYKPMPPGDEPGQKRTLATIGVLEDEQGLNTPLAKKMKSEVETSEPSGRLSLPLQDITNIQGGLRAVPGNMTETSRSEKEEETYEEKQKRLWADVDPAIYEEFHDIVELVED